MHLLHVRNATHGYRKERLQRRAIGRLSAQRNEMDDLHVTVYNQKYVVRAGAERRQVLHDESRQVDLSPIDRLRRVHCLHFAVRALLDETPDLKKTVVCEEVNDAILQMVLLACVYHEVAKEARTPEV